jgi:hypothetical protein
VVVFVSANVERAQLDVRIFVVLYVALGFSDQHLIPCLPGVAIRANVNE